MRQEKLFKLLVLGFIVIMLILGSFIYGNIVRNRQNKSASQNNSNSTNQSNSSTSGSQPQPAPVQQGTNQAKPPAETPPQSAATPAQKPAAPSNGAIPNTGIELHYEAIPATIMATLGYIYIKQRKSQAQR